MGDSNNSNSNSEQLRKQGHTLISDLAGLIAGLQVTRSSGGGFLGTGLEPWDRLWTTHLGLIGWQKKEEVEAALRQAIAVEVVRAMGMFANTQISEPFPCPGCESALVSRDFNQCPYCGWLLFEEEETNG